MADPAAPTTDKLVFMSLFIRWTLFIREIMIMREGGALFIREIMIMREGGQFLLL